ncbi:MAG: HlyD family efflux transporter periplasmic adaptor subunit [Sulfurimonas sp.]|jgi:multidrug efflux pump subunit AcrA (membrane-fusion protein)|nr:HlyD family efflux transporter periplasmic adaptor subunit [Sulfurimonas sp.]
MNQAKLPYLVRLNPLILIFGSLLIVIIPFLVWANYTYIDQKSTTKGNVIASQKTQKIQSAIDGVIKDIRVKEGEIVQSGDLLVTLEKEQNKAALDAIQSKIASLRVKLFRLNAEVYAKALNYPEDFVSQEYIEFIDTQKKLFSLRQKAINDEIISFQNSLNLKREELRLNQPLLKSGDIGRMKLINIEKEISELVGKILNSKNRYFQTAQEEMTKAEEELSINEQLLAEKAVTLQRSEIYSQMNAIVKNILITTLGAKVRPGDVILELVPMDDKLIIEAKLSPIDISYVKVGQRAYVKLDTYDFSIYGMFDAEVSYISPDTIIEETSKGEEYHFKVQITLQKSSLVAKNAEQIKIAPGMGAQIDIITGKRTVMHYLSKPIIKTLDESFIER